jgi:hypothetical protein
VIGPVPPPSSTTVPSPAGKADAMARASGALLGVTEATRKGEANHFEKNISSELCFIVYGLFRHPHSWTFNRQPGS